MTIESSPNEGTTYKLSFKTTCLVHELLNGAAQFPFSYFRSSSDNLTQQINEMKINY